MIRATTFGQRKRYMWFRENLLGRATHADGTRSLLALDLIASLASMRQLLDENRIDLAGSVTCPSVHPRPLHVTEGTLVGASPLGARPPRLERGVADAAAHRA